MALRSFQVGLIVGGTIAILLVFTLFCFLRRNRLKRQQEHLFPGENSTISFSNLQSFSHVSLFQRSSSSSLQISSRNRRTPALIELSDSIRSSKPVPLERLHPSHPVLKPITVLTRNSSQRRFNPGLGDRVIGITYRSKTVEVFEVWFGHHPIRSDEIELHVGDTVALRKVYSDGWCEGIRIRKGETAGLIGIFPIDCITKQPYILSMPIVSTSSGIEIVNQFKAPSFVDNSFDSESFKVSRKFDSLSRTNFATGSVDRPYVSPNPPINALGNSRPWSVIELDSMKPVAYNVPPSSSLFANITLPRKQSNNTELRLESSFSMHGNHGSVSSAIHRYSLSSKTPTPPFNFGEQVSGDVDWSTHASNGGFSSRNSRSNSDTSDSKLDFGTNGVPVDMFWNKDLPFSPLQQQRPRKLQHTRSRSLFTYFSGSNEVNIPSRADSNKSKKVLPLTLPTGEKLEPADDTNNDIGSPSEILPQHKRSRSLSTYFNRSDAKFFRRNFSVESRNLIANESTTDTQTTMIQVQQPLMNDLYLKILENDTQSHLKDALQRVATRRKQSGGDDLISVEVLSKLNGSHDGESTLSRTLTRSITNSNSNSTLKREKLLPSLPPINTNITPPVIFPENNLENDPTTPTPHHPHPARILNKIMSESITNSPVTPSQITNFYQQNQPSDPPESFSSLIASKFESESRASSALSFPISEYYEARTPTLDL
ncbi:hypothetical protein HK098_000496 [Nowakowskiella sp. JEL0407]|nr:hypothetical protein HK098_000496 [Nowakowskiella sp. JEL0407]